MWHHVIEKDYEKVNQQFWSSLFLQQYKNLSALYLCIIYDKYIWLSTNKIRRRKDCSCAMNEQNEYGE